MEELAEKPDISTKSVKGILERLTEAEDEARSVREMLVALAEPIMTEKDLDNILRIKGDFPLDPIDASLRAKRVEINLSAVDLTFKRTETLFIEGKDDDYV